MRGIKTTLVLTLCIGLVAGSAVAVAAQEKTAPSVEFSGKTMIVAWQCVGARSSVWANGVNRTASASRGKYCKPSIIEPFSDPRLQGELLVWRDYDTYKGGPAVSRMGTSIKNDAGTWQQVPGVVIDFRDGTASTSIEVLEGTGAYAGFTAIAEIERDRDLWTWRGWIIDGEPPPVPESPAAAR